MSSQEVTLTCEGHYLTLLGIFERLLEKGSLVDCTLTAEGKSLRAHREVLSAFSPFFQLLFEEAKEKEPTIVLSGFSYQDLSALIDYVYCGRVKIPEDRVKNLIDCAQSLHMKGLDGQDKVVFENKKAQSNEITSPLCVTQRKSINKRETTGASTTKSAKEIQTHRRRVSQEPPATVPKISRDSTGTCFNSSQASSVNYERSGSNVPFSYEQTILPVNDSAITPAHAINTVSPDSDVQIFMPECELEVHIKSEDRDESLCEPSRNSCKVDDAEAILGLSREIRMNDGQNLYESLPAVQNCSDFSNLPTVDIPSEAVNTPCSRSTVNVSRSMNEQNRDMNFAPSEYSSLPSGEREEDMLTSELLLKTETISQDDNLTDGVENDLGEMEVFEGEVESEQQEESFQNSGAEFIMKEVPMESELLTNWSESVFIERTINRGKSTFGVPEGRSNPPTHLEAMGSSSAVSQRTLKKPRIIRRTQKDRHLTCPKGSYETNFPTIPTRPKIIYKGDKYYKCSLCPYVSVTKHSLVEHIHTHTGEKPYRCSECDYATRFPGELTKHKRTHTGEKPFKCPLCNYATGSSSSLYHHKRDMHTSEKPFKCFHCPYAAKRNCHLQRHILLHTGKKPHKCSVCNYEAARSDHLTRHMRIHYF